MTDDRLRTAAFLARYEGDSSPINFLERHTSHREDVRNALAYWRFRRMVSDMFKLGMISREEATEMRGGRRWNYFHHRAMDALIEGETGNETEDDELA